MSVHSRANNKWRKNNRTQVQLLLTVEQKELIKSLSGLNNMSMTAYIMNLVDQDSHKYKS